MRKSAKTILAGFVVLCILIAWAVCPVAADGNRDTNKERSIGDQKHGDDNFDHDDSPVPREGYDEWHRCNYRPPASFSEVPNLTLDSALVTATPHWIFLAAGEKEQKALLSFLNSADIPEKKQAEWKRFLIGIWNKYPVRYVKTKDSAILKLGSSHGKFSMTAKENETFREIEAYIAQEMDKIQQNTIIPMWAPQSHSNFIVVAFKQKEPILQTDPYYLNILERSAQEPDEWYNNDPIPFDHQIHHGFVPIGIIVPSFPIIILPPQIVGLGLAPDNYGKYASLAKQEFSSRDYANSFKDMSYASHFISDLGNPYHTPMVQIIPLQFVDSPFSSIIFPNTDMIVNYVALHNNYEHYLDANFASFTITGESYEPLDPTYWAKGHGVVSWSMSYPLIYSSYWHFVINHNYDFATNPAIVSITQNRVSETIKHNNGLVQYVTGGQPITFTITPLSGPGGSISPSGPVTLTYGQTQTFTIQPASNYAIDDLKVNGESKGQVSQFTFDIDTLNKAKGDQTIEAIFKSTEPVSIYVSSYNGGFPQYHVPNYDDEPWSVMRSAEGNEMGSGLHLLTGNADNEYRILSRPVFVFRDPLSSVPPGSTITSVTFVWYVPYSYNTLWPYPSIELTSGSVSNSEAIQASDYQRAGATVLSDSYPVGWFGGSNPVEIPLNAAGKSYVDTAGDAAVFVRFTSDVDGTSPRWSYLSRIYLEGAPHAQLQIEYI